jgi:predicted metal-dependent peptidase
MKKAVYWTDIVYAFILVPTKAVDTMAVTQGLVLFYNEEFVEQIPQDSVAAALAHEICHILQRHIERLPLLPGDPLAMLASIAGDLTINPALKASGWATMSDWAFPEQFKLKNNGTQEQYFEALKELAKGGGGKGEQEGPGKLGCGSCMAKDPKDSGMKSAAESLGRPQVTVDSLLQGTFKAMQEHSKRHGSIAGFSSEFLDLALRPPRVPWQKELGYVMRKVVGQVVSGGSDLSLKRPSKRSYARGIPRPGLIHRTPELALIVDTSGSMGASDFTEAISESLDVAARLQVSRAWMLHADVGVAFCQYLPLQAIKQKKDFHGRGGTDFSRAIETLGTLRPRPQLAIYFTDGYGSSQVTPPADIELIWAITTTGEEAPTPPFGHVVRIPK